MKQPDFRMRDAEILLRYIAYKNFINDYNGNLKHFLDQATRFFNQEWNAQKGLIESQVESMEAAFAFTREVFGDDSYLRKWNGERFEPKKNRAIFDIMLHFFSNGDVREKLTGKRRTS